VTEFSRMEKLLLAVKHPQVSDMRWSGTSAWSTVEAMDSVRLSKAVEKIHSASFFSISLDEATTVDNRTMLSIHAYVMEDWEHKPVLGGFFEVSSAASLSSQLGHAVHLAC
jgi:hypothetical protein